MHDAPEIGMTAELETANAQPRFFRPFGDAASERRCASCRHAIGWDSVHVYCQRARIVPVYACGCWEREPGCD